MTSSRRAAIVALLFVYLAVRVFWWYEGQESSAFVRFLAATGFLKIVLWVFPSMAAVVLVRRIAVPEALSYLGLDADLPRGIKFGFLATLPLAFAAVFAPPELIDPAALVGIVLVGPFAEEVLFRGFLLKELLSQARWPAAWAIGVSAIAFGAAHAPDFDMKMIGSLFQLTTHRAELAESRLFSLAVGVLMMSAGGVVFGWVFYRFGSLWPALAFHGCLNLWLTLSDGSGGPPIGVIGVAQIASFALAILLTFQRRSLASSPSPVRLS